MTGTQGSPTICDGGVVVVLEGAARLQWEALKFGEQRLRGVWPTSGETETLFSGLDGTGILVVVLEREPALTAVFAHEVEMEMARFETVTALSDLVEIRVPILDWMPEPLRVRGMTFIDEAAVHTFGRLLAPEVRR